MPQVSESISLPVSEGTAYSIVSDLELMLRLSPFWSLKGFKRVTHGELMPGSRFEAELEYYGRGSSENHTVEVSGLVPGKKIAWKFGRGDLKEVSFTIDTVGDGILLTQHSLIESDDQAVAGAISAELSSWLKSTGEYLKIAGRTSLCGRISKYLMDKVWLRLTLPERKIALIIIALSAIEILLLILMVLAWNIYQRLDLVQKIFRGGP